MNIHLGARCALCLMLLLLPLTASAVPSFIVDEMTGTRFVEQPTLSGTTFQCLGVGSQKVFTFKIYSMAFCLDAAHANEVVSKALLSHPDKAGHSLADAIKDDDSFFEDLIHIPGEKMVVMRFARDIDQNKLEGSLRGVLEKHLTPQDAGRLTASIATSTGVKSGDVAILRSQGDSFVVQLGQQRQVVPNAASINQRLWQLYLGRESDIPNLKESIAARIATRAIGGSGASGLTLLAPE